MAGSSVIDSLSAKIERLMAEHDKALARNAELSRERTKLAEENKTLKQTTASLERRIGVWELGNGLTGTATDTKRARARINQLVREIDRCIALMNR